MVRQKALKKQTISHIIAKCEEFVLSSVSVSMDGVLYDPDYNYHCNELDAFILILQDTLESYIMHFEEERFGSDTYVDIEDIKE
jgi:hypothetical protein